MPVDNLVNSLVTRIVTVATYKRIFSQDQMMKIISFTKWELSTWLTVTVTVTFTAFAAIVTNVVMISKYIF